LLIVRYIQLHVNLDPCATFQYVPTNVRQLDSAIFHKQFLKIGNSHSFCDRGRLTVARFEPLSVRLIALSRGLSQGKFFAHPGATTMQTISNKAFTCNTS